MKILVVDDEFYPRKAVVKMLKEKYGETISVNEAENGTKAIEAIGEEMPDLVLTDVRMPETDGLQLAKYISDNNLKCSVIIFSGYADFEYAQKALRYGAEDYILKPVKKENLFETVDRVKEKISKTIMLQANEIMMQSRLLQADRILEEGKFNEIIRKNSNTGKCKYSQLLKLEREPLYYKMFVLLMKDNFNEKDKEALLVAFKNTGENLIFTFFNNTYRNELDILCFGMEDKYEYMELPKQYYHIKEIYNSLRERGAVIGASRILPCEVSAPSAYEEAKAAALIHYVTGWGKIYEFEKIKEHWSKKKFTYDEELRIFRHLLEEGKEEAAISGIRNIFRVIKEEKPLSMTQLKETCIKLSNTISDVFKEVHIKQFDFLNFHEVQEIEDYYYELVRQACSFIETKSSYNQSSMVNELLEYIKEHYYEDISLEEIAKEKYFMNFSYLSRIFKSETGETFSGALLRIRMEKAKKLLLEKDIPVTQVAVLTGYNNTAYFVKMFKKYYGETPGEYKKSLTKL